MKKRKIILASNSPRRHELLLSAGIEHSVLNLTIDETPNSKDFIESSESFSVWYSRESALVKCRAAAKEIFKNSSSNTVKNETNSAVIITADTVVSPDGEKIYGKPANKEEAENFLCSLSGKEHMVVGGICIADRNQVITSSVITRVKFKELDLNTIKRYINTGESSDKAGAYGIQGKGAFFAESINGDYSNVVGLSVFEVGKILENNFDYILF